MESDLVNADISQDSLKAVGQSIRRDPLRSVSLAALLTIAAILIGIQSNRSNAKGYIVQVATQQPPHSPDLQLAQSLSEKEDMAARFAASVGSGQLSPAPRFAIQAAPSLPRAENPPFRTGIITGEPGPFYAEELFVENLWQDIGENGFVQIFAGALGNDLSQGVVVVLTTSSNRIQGFEEWVMTPSKTGAVRIVAVDDGFLVLHSSQGGRILFDWEKRSFIESQ